MQYAPYFHGGARSLYGKKLKTGFYIDKGSRGGKILAAGDSWGTIPAHRNLFRIPADQCVAAAARKIVNE